MGFEHGSIRCVLLVIVVWLHGESIDAMRLLRGFKEFIWPQETMDEDSTHKVSALHLAVTRGSVDLVRFLLFFSDVDVQDRDGDTPLHLAVYQGLSDIVQLLLDDEASIDMRNHHGQTPLLYAVKGGQGGMVRALLQRGADVGARDSYGRTAMHYAAMFGYNGIIVILAEYQEEQLAHQAERNGQRPYKQELTLVSDADNDGAVPLDYAKVLGNEDIVNTLRAWRAEEVS